MHPVHDLPEGMSGKQRYLWSQTDCKNEIRSRPLKTGISHNRLDQHGNYTFYKIELYKKYQQREDVYYPSAGRCGRKRHSCTLYTVRRVYEGLQDQWTAPCVIRGWN